MRKTLARGLLIVTVFTAFASLGAPASAHHGIAANGKLHHCRWNPHTHPDSFFDGKSAAFVRRHKHHSHQCNPNNYPPA